MSNEHTEQSERAEFDVVLDVLQKHRDQLLEINKYAGTGIMGSIRWKQIDELEDAIQKHKTALLAADRPAESGGEACGWMRVVMGHTSWVVAEVEWGKDRPTKLGTWLPLYTQPQPSALPAEVVKDARQVIDSIKQEAETGLVIGDEIGMRDALEQIIKEACAVLGITTFDAAMLKEGK